MLLPKRLFVGLTFGFVAAISLPVLAYPPHHPSVAQVSPDDEMYEVYSAAIKELYLNEREKTQGYNGVEGLVVIKDRTASPRWGTSMTDKMSLLSSTAVDSETIQDFDRKSKNSIPLVPRFKLAARQVLISDEEFFGFFNGTGGGWPGFYERYPTSLGYVSLSPIGFNRDHSQALLYTARFWGGLCGEGYSVLLGKDGLVWSVKHKDTLWVS